ncbi:MAG: hypothetical protein R3350_02175 [Saprospiraceae bacterium]|nr:hypothetical protein [Saprospiraceae bacterium]
MVPILSLWLPIVLSAVAVFIVSTLIHMLLPYHRTDFKKVPQEAEVMAALREFDIPPGDYSMPRPADMKEMQSEEFVEKQKRGPVLMMTVFRSEPIAMTGSMIQWFIYSLVVSIFAAYIAGRALEPAAPYLEVFRFAGSTAFIGYSLALVQDSIWFKRSWSITWKYVFDGLLYGLTTAGVFGWLWPGI